MSMVEEGFEEGAPRQSPPVGPGLVVDLDGFEGPIDVLLSLARDQKVDLRQISILQLADQYLEWVAEARRHDLELAADYLVMAAWLAYLKSRLLLPEDKKTEAEPTGEEMAAALAFQLRRLEAMQDAAARLQARPLLGRDVFARGTPEEFKTMAKAVWEVSLYDLLKAYGEQKRRVETSTMPIEPMDLYAVQDVLVRFESMLGRMPDWRTLETFLPPFLKDGLIRRSAVAATFNAALELVKSGRVEIRQSGLFGPIFVRPAGSPEAPAAEPQPETTETPS